MFQSIVVVPCYREELRFPREAFLEFLNRQTCVDLLFVDDGSTDGTGATLASVVAAVPRRARVLTLPANRGKAEAVRRGILAALDLRPTYVGYWDADLATPLPVIHEFADMLDRSPGVQLVIGARVQLLGRHIVRNGVRHYFGRAFATAASIVLSLPVYDTQCGAKLFRVSDTCRELFERPFLSGWAFDVEILARLTCLHRAGRVPHPAQIVVEYPLQEWTDVGESKVRPSDFARAFRDLFRIYVRYFVARNPLGTT